jgi:hypothetical protein
VAIRHLLKQLNTFAQTAHNLIAYGITEEVIGALTLHVGCLRLSCSRQKPPGPKIWEYPEYFEEYSKANDDNSKKTPYRPGPAIVGDYNDP